MPPAVRVTGVKELYRDFNRISADLGDHLKDALVEAAEPVSSTAEALALGRIRHMPATPEWAVMRVGVSKREALVYMVPNQRSRKRNTKNRSQRQKDKFFELMDERAMNPAMEQNTENVTRDLDNALDNLGRKNGF